MQQHTVRLGIKCRVDIMLQRDFGVKVFAI